MNKETLTYKKIFLFWIPLAATWLMMSLEGPFLAAVIARMAEPKFNLAAYGVAFAIALLFESPIIMIMTASTALVKNRQSYLKLRNFTYSLNVILTVLMLIGTVPLIFNFFVENLIGLPHHVAQLTRSAIILLLPWPAAIGYRRFNYGILIANNLTKRVAVGTVTRLITMGTTAVLLYNLTGFHGVEVGAAALAAGVTMEAIMSKIMVHSTIKKLKFKDGDIGSINYTGIINFYYPLALTAFISLAAQPMVTFFLSQSQKAIESLAVIPVVTALTFVFRSFGLSFQEVGIALIGDNWEGYKPLRNFAVIAGGIATIFLMLIAFTPLADIWFHSVSGLSVELTSFSKLPIKIMAIFPALTFLIAFQRAILVNARHTVPITVGTAIEVSVILLILLVLIHYLNFIGVIAATIAYVTGRITANAYLMFPFKNLVKENIRKYHKEKL